MRTFVLQIIVVGSNMIHATELLRKFLITKFALIGFLATVCLDMFASLTPASRSEITRVFRTLVNASGLKTEGYAIATLEASATQSLFSYQAPARTVFVLGGETSGVSDAVNQLADQPLAIPMSNTVESRNVALLRPR